MQRISLFAIAAAVFGLAVPEAATAQVRGRNAAANSRNRIVNPQVAAAKAQAAAAPPATNATSVRPERDERYDRYGNSIDYVPSQPGGVITDELAAKIQNVRGKCLNIFAGQDTMKGLNTASIVTSSIGTAAGAVGIISTSMRMGQESKAEQEKKKLSAAGEQAVEAARAEVFAKVRDHHTYEGKLLPLNYQGILDRIDFLRDKLGENKVSMNKLFGFTTVSAQQITPPAYKSCNSRNLQPNQREIADWFCCYINFGDPNRNPPDCSSSNIVIDQAWMNWSKAQYKDEGRSCLGKTERHTNGQTKFMSKENCIINDGSGKVNPSPNPVPPDNLAVILKEIGELKTSVNTLSSKIDNLKISELDKEQNAVLERLKKIEEKQDAAEAKREALAKELKDALANIQRGEAADDTIVRDVQSKLAEVQTAIAQLAGEKAEAQKIADEAAKNLKAAQNTYKETNDLLLYAKTEAERIAGEMTETNRQAQQALADAIRINGETSELAKQAKETLDSVQETNRQIQATLAAINTQLGEMQKLMDQAAKNLADAEKLNSETQTALGEIRAETARLATMLDNAKKEAERILAEMGVILEQTKDNLDKSNKNLDQANARHAAAEEMELTSKRRKELSELLALKARIEEEAMAAGRAKELEARSAADAIKTGTGFASNKVTLGAAITGTVASTSSLITSAVLSGEIDKLAKRIDECEAAVRELQ